MKKSNILVSSLVIVLALSGCTSMQSIRGSSNSDVILQKVDPGDVIHVETLDGSKHEIRVESITPKKIKGGNIEIPIEEIKVVKKEQVDILKSSGAVLGAYVVYGSILYLIILTAIF